ncbi:hypothetical protein PISMIDRAFT_65912, partial [Pisolithus microcarpus 441]
FIPPNHCNILDCHNAIHEYISDKLCLGHMSGPFSFEQLYYKIRAFCTSPFQIVIKQVMAGSPPKIWVCCNLSYKGPLCLSIDNQINSDDFPT